MAVHAVTAYARAVVNGTEIAGPHVRATCQRHLDDLKRKDVVFVPELADDAIHFFPDVLQHSAGKFDGLPFELHPSQIFIIGSLFGWVRKRPGVGAKHCHRRFKKVYIEEGKGNGKTPLAAGVAIYCTVADTEPGAEGYIAASTEDQAQICMRDVVQMIKASPELSEQSSFNGIKDPDKVTFPSTASFIKTVSSKFGESGSGFRPHLGILDELHEHKNDLVLETLESGFKWRDQPIMFEITNSGIVSDTSVCYSEHSYAIRVAHGEVLDDSLFSYVCALDENEDPFADGVTDKELRVMMKKANPLLDEIMTFEYLKGEVIKGRALPGKRNKILRLNFCKWVNATTAWISRQLWLACESDELERKAILGQRLYIGIDLSEKLDLTSVAYVAIVGETDDGQPIMHAFVDSYTPEDTIVERAAQDVAPYLEWVDSGDLMTTPGKKIRYDYVATDLISRISERDVGVIAYDNRSFDRFQEALDKAGGIDAYQVEQHPQGTNRSQQSNLWMPKSIDELESLILEGRLKVVINKPLRQAVSSATFYETTGGHRRFIKGHANARIDPLLALTMAIGAAHEFSKTESSPWDDEEFNYQEWAGTN